MNVTFVGHVDAPSPDSAIVFDEVPIKVEPVFEYILQVKLPVGVPVLYIANVSDLSCLPVGHARVVKL